MDSHGNRLGWVTLFNLLLLIAEYVGGVLSGSLALISDAGHKLTDVISLVVSCFGEKLSNRKPTEKFSFGYKRVEVITALANSLALFAVGFFIIHEAFERIGNPDTINTNIMIPIALLGLFADFASLAVMHKHKDHTLNIKSAYMHMLFDGISSIGVVISAILISFTGIYSIDLIVSFFIAAMVFWGAFGIIKKVLNILLQGVPDGIDFEEVHKAIIKVDGVLSLHDLHIWNISSCEIFLSCHVCAEKSKKSDSVIKQVNKVLQEFGIMHTAIQIEHGKKSCGSIVCNKC